MPIPLGILAAAGFRPTAGGSYELIETITVGSGGAASVTFSNLNTYSATYQHLQVRAVALFDITNSSLVGRLNADGGNNYAYHRINGNGSSVFSGGATTKSNMVFHYNQDNTSTNEPGVAVIDLLDPYETGKFKTTRSLAGTSSGSSKNQINLWSSLWQSTNAVSSFSLSVATSYDGWQAGNFRQGSRFSIYGIRSS